MYCNLSFTAVDRNGKATKVHEHYCQTLSCYKSVESSRGYERSVRNVACNLLRAVVVIANVNEKRGKTRLDMA
jgi:hypothetical protein